MHLLRSVVHGWNLLEQQTGEFTQAKGQEVMESLLKQYDNINVVYCENDNEAFGAIEAIKAAGKTVGPDGDILVMSFDTTLSNSFRLAKHQRNRHM